MNTGGPAFPYVADVVQMDGNTAVVKNYTQGGMTLRDFFAAKAMQGLLSTENEKATSIEVAQAAYALADAMLKARGQ